ncbi:hypothetical protein NCH01_09590 [Neoasaia chiangmaiensis]|nr:hypothetical protein NCH01_09590 [Neoasaia chiangmaiensis]
MNLEQMDIRAVRKAVHYGASGAFRTAEGVDVLNDEADAHGFQLVVKTCRKCKCQKG